MSITLSTPAQVNTVLGGNILVGYDHVVLSPLNLNAVDRKITGTVRLTSSSDPDMDALLGKLLIELGQGILLIEIDQLDIRRKMQLTPAQITAVQNILNDAQNSIETGLISINVIAGTQSTGT